MKRFFLLLVLFSVGFWGCSESTNPIDPVKNETHKSFLKVSPNASMSLMKTEVSQDIDGARGGIVFIRLDSENDNGESQYGARGWLYFPRGSFEGTQTIGVAIAEDMAALDFSPSGLQFDKPARLTVKFSGVEIGADDDIDFMYIDENGNLAPVEYRRLIVNRWLGWVIVVGAKLDHFSRYGFTK